MSFPPVPCSESPELFGGPAPGGVHQLVHHVQAERDLAADHHQPGGQQRRQRADTDRQCHHERHEEHIDDAAAVDHPGQRMGIDK